MAYLLEYLRSQLRFPSEPSSFHYSVQQRISSFNHADSAHIRRIIPEARVMQRPPPGSNALASIAPYSALQAGEQHDLRSRLGRMSNMSWDLGELRDWFRKLDFRRHGIAIELQ